MFLYMLTEHFGVLFIWSHLFQTWSSDIRNVESTMGTLENDVAGEDDSDLPPIRSGKITLTAEGVSHLSQTCLHSNKYRNHRFSEKEIEKLQVQ